MEEFSEEHPRLANRRPATCEEGIFEKNEVLQVLKEYGYSKASTYLDFDDDVSERYQSNDSFVPNLGLLINEDTGIPPPDFVCREEGDGHKATDFEGCDKLYDSFPLSKKA
ncbi:hypothetical protein U1Q18_036722 [Sarracenia purpurea var. burkii]